MNWRTHYERWKHDEQLDQELREQLTRISSDEKLLEDCFYKNLEFGTGGMRGEIGPGINRMNRYTVRKAAEGLARTIEESGEAAKTRGVVIAYDSRHKSRAFALEAALTLGYHGIRTYLFDELRPTPVLSFAVRHLRAFAGIVITASHNPPEYNGFKVYGEDGGQLTPAPAERIMKKVNEIENELAIAIADEQALIQSGLMMYIGKEIDQAYLAQLKTLVVNQDVINEMKRELRIVFTPLHGTGNKPVREGLEAVGFENITVVKEQERPDPNFSTVQTPNPEEHASFDLAIQYGKTVNADLLIATDPDADRLGVAVKNERGDYIALTGNEIGALMLHYLLSEKKKKGSVAKNGVVLKTIVTSEIGRAIADEYQLETVDTLTGFKFIAEKIDEFHRSQSHTFVFGYEESYGYLIGDFVRDKDAIQASIFIAEAAAYFKMKGMTLYEALLSLFEKYGYYREGLHSITLKGKQGSERIQAILGHFRETPPMDMAGHGVVAVEDYNAATRYFIKENHKEPIPLPKSNVLKYILDDGSWVCLRPSGTEPKIKCYFGVKGSSLADAETRLNELKDDVMARINPIIGRR